MSARWYVAVTMHAWGRGRTVREAVGNMLRVGGRGTPRRIGYVVKLLPDGATDPYVDEVGCIRWDGTGGLTVTVRDTRKKT